MTATQLITILQELVEEHGDCTLVSELDHFGGAIYSVEVDHYYPFVALIDHNEKIVKKHSTKQIAHDDNLSTVFVIGKLNH